MLWDDMISEDMANAPEFARLLSVAIFQVRRKAKKLSRRSTFRSFSFGTLTDA